jgi:cytochrome c-type biogenesis protein CcmH
MLECHYSHPARQKIALLESQGKTDDQVVDSFVKDQGLQALSAPPTSGFSGLAWVMPWVAIALGLAAIYFFIRRFHPQRAPAPEIDAEVMQKYRDTIDKDLDKLD